MRMKKASGMVLYMALPSGGRTASKGLTSTAKMGSTKAQQRQKPTAAAMRQRTSRQRISLRCSSRLMGFSAGSGVSSSSLGG